MRAVIAGFDRGVHSCTFPAVSTAAAVLSRNGWDVINPVSQDNRTMWPTGISPPTKAFRNLAIVEDVKSLSEPGVTLFLMPGWTQYEEAHAMVAVARAMGRDVQDLPESIFNKELECQESS